MARGNAVKYWAFNPIFDFFKPHVIIAFLGTLLGPLVDN